VQFHSAGQIEGNWRARRHALEAEPKKQGRARGSSGVRRKNPAIRSEVSDRQRGGASAPVLRSRPHVQTGDSHSVIVIRGRSSAAAQVGLHSGLALSDKPAGVRK